jgi:hypothetical protein
MPQAPTRNPRKPVLATRLIGPYGFNSTADEQPLLPSLGVTIDFPIAPAPKEDDLEDTDPVTTRIVGP